VLVTLHADSFRFYNMSSLLIVNHAVIVVLDQNLSMNGLQWDKNI
jgi:hypothetical protein